MPNQILLLQSNKRRNTKLPIQVSLQQSKPTRKGDGRYPKYHLQVSKDLIKEMSHVRSRDPPTQQATKLLQENRDVRKL